MATPYTIAKGDTLSGIAQKNNTTVANLQSYNPQITNPNLIQAGASLNLSAPVNTTIDGSLLGKTTSIKIAPITTPSTAGNLATSNNSIISNIKTDSTYTPPEDAKTKEKKTLTETFLSTIKGNQEEISTLQKDTEVAEKKQRAIKISNELDQMEKDYRDEVNRIKLNPEGKFGGGLEADINRATDRYQNNRANVALTYKVASGDYQGAQEVINNKISSLREYGTSALNIYKTQLDNIKDDLTESEKLNAQSQIKIKEMGIESLAKTYSDILSLSSQNNVPASVLSNLDSLYADFNDGKISATEAQSRMYKAASGYTIKKSDVPLGKYSTLQDKYIDGINQGISNNFTYKAVNSAKNFADGVLSQLALKTGLADVTAINQFQKVIDEGAVTRDADVKIVQGAQSLINSLKLKIDKLSKGEQLSDEQRADMKESVTALYNAKVRSLEDDPYVKAQAIKAVQNGIDVGDTILGQLGTYGKSADEVPVSSGGIQATNDDAYSKYLEITGQKPKNVKPEVKPSQEPRKTYLSTQKLDFKDPLQMFNFDSFFK